MEPRNQPVWSADAVSLCGRRDPIQRERELDGDPTGSQTPRMHGNTSYENREIPGASGRPLRCRGAGAQREVERRTPLMHESGKSDNRVVPEKAPNKAGRRAAEGLEGRRLAKRNSRQAATRRTQGRARVQAALERVRQAAEQQKGVRFTALLHHIYAIDTLRAAFYEMERDAAPGVDGETWEHYGQDLEARLAELSDRVRRGTYRPQPVRRVYIPKRGNAKQQRPIGVTAVEDKLVQRATSMVLNAVYELEFAGFSYGARPGRSAHQALTALDQALHMKRVKWVLDADLRDFFGSLEHEWLVRFVEHRIGDKRVVRLIQQWLAAGVLEDGAWTRSETGTPQGGSISPLAANLYMHYVFDVWAQRWRRTAARGDVVIVRYLDDFIVGFRYRTDAEVFLKALRERLGQFGLRLHPDKTRLLEFGRYAAQNRRERGQGKPESFQFLGFVHSCGQTSKGEFTVRRQTAGERLRAKLREVKAELWRRRHAPIPEVGKWLGSVVRGHGQYYGIPGNWRAIRRFRDEASRHWHQALSRRSQKGRVRWDRMQRLIKRWLPPARIVHPSSWVMFAVMTQGRSPVW
jgi:RNA-directed DNA polymerase